MKQRERGREKQIKVGGVCEIFFRNNFRIFLEQVQFRMRLTFNHDDDDGMITRLIKAKDTSTSRGVSY